MVVLVEELEREPERREAALRLLAARPALRVLYMSGYPQGTTTQSVALGAAGVLQKPFTVQALLGAVRVALDE